MTDSDSSLIYALMVFGLIFLCAALRGAKGKPKG